MPRHVVSEFVTFVGALALIACGDTSGSDNPSQCPSEHPAVGALETYPSCDESQRDVICHYPAVACPAGTFPDNVCTCDGHDWKCDSHVRNCLPFGDAHARLSDHLRPPPVGRPSAAACADPADQPRGLGCEPERDYGGGTCSDNGACDDDAVCLDRHAFGSASHCECVTAECLSDDDCPSSSACTCGRVDAEKECGGPWDREGCAHACVPAQCHSDADCGPGGTCSASFDVCSSHVVELACHRAGVDECLTDRECQYARGGDVCLHASDLDRWHCASRPLCD